jgi:hypothetical protein
MTPAQQVKVRCIKCGGRFFSPEHGGGPQGMFHNNSDDCRVALARESGAEVKPSELVTPAAQAVIDAAVKYRNATMEFLLHLGSDELWAARAVASVNLCEAVAAYEKERG